MSQLPRIGDSVTLDLPQREHISARVDRVSAGILELDLLERPRTPSHQLASARLMLEFINEDGVARLHGRLEGGIDPARPVGRFYGEGGVVRFAHRGGVQLLRRREFIRAPAALPLTIMPLVGLDALARRVQTAEISGDGMVVRGIAEPEPGEGYRFELDLGTGDLPIQGQFRVIAAQGSDRAAVHFTALDQQDRIRVMRRAFELSRHSRRRSA